MQDRKTPAQIDAELKLMASDPNYDAKKIDYLDALSDEEIQQYAEYTTNTLQRKPEGEATQLPGRKFTVASSTPWIRPAGGKLLDATPADVDIMPERDVKRLNAIMGVEPPAEEPKGWLDGNLGMTARAAGKGAMALPGLVADYTLLPLVDSMTGEGVSEVGTQGLLDSAFDQAGAKMPQTPGERIYSDVVAGLAGVGPGMLAMKGAGKGLTAAREGTLANKAGQWLTRNATAQPMLQTASAGLGGYGAGAAREAGGGSMEQLVAALAAGSIPQMLAASGGAATRAAVRGRNPAPMREAIETFERAGTMPSVAEATGGRRAAGVESFLSRFFPSSRVMQDFARGQEAQIGAKVDDLTNALAQNTRPTAAGNMIPKSVEEDFLPAARQIISDEYKAFDDLFPMDTPINIDKFKTFVNDRAAPKPGIGRLSRNTTINPSAKNWGTVAQDLKMDLNKSGQQLPFSSVKELRSMIGSQLSDAIFDTEVPVKELRAAYGSLSDDMRTAAAARGNGALEQLNIATKRAEELFDHMELIRPIIEKQGGGEKIFKALLSDPVDGATRLQAVYNSINPEARKYLSASIISRAAKPEAGSDGFDLQTFFKRYDKFSPEAKEAIFGSVGPEFAKDFAKIREVAAKLKHGRDDFGYASSPKEGRTGLHWILYPLMFGASGTVGAMTGSGLGNLGMAAGVVAGTGGVALGANRLARWMTNPKVVHWLAKSNSVPASQVPQMIQQLEQQGRRDGDTDLTAFSEYLQERLKEGKQ